MNPSDKQNRLAASLMELEVDYGATEMTALFFTTLKKSIEGLEYDHLDHFCEEWDFFLTFATTTKPRFGAINTYLQSLKKRCEGSYISQENKIREILLGIEEILESVKGDQNDLLNSIANIDVRGKTILIYDHSHTVHRALELLQKKYHGNFKVVVAEQEYQKTHENIEVLHRLGISFQVVPDYMISHIQDSIDMIFLGAVTLKDTMHFVTDPGVYSLLSQFKNYPDVKNFIFCTTQKFSLWKSEPKDEISFKQSTKKHPKNSEIEYERLKYSHDRIPVSYFYQIVTEKGIFSAEECEKEFFELMKQVG